MRENICALCRTRPRDFSHLCARCAVEISTWVGAIEGQTTQYMGRRVRSLYLGTTDRDGNRRGIEVSTAHLGESHLYVVDAFRVRITPQGFSLSAWGPNDGWRLDTRGVKRFSAKRLEAIHGDAIKRIRVAPQADDLRKWMVAHLAGSVREAVAS